ncbi:MAG: ribosome silencing factor [Gammaproteobacteria bacterium]
MSKTPLKDTIVDALNDMKAKDITVLDVREMTTITDTMVIASGTSDRHVRSLAEAVIEQCKKKGQRPVGVEGLESGEWVLVDVEDVLVHVMVPRVRDFYNLEKLWSMTSDLGAAAPVG